MTAVHPAIRVHCTWTAFASAFCWQYRRVEFDQCWVDAIPAATKWAWSSFQCPQPSQRHNSYTTIHIMHFMYNWQMWTKSSRMSTSVRWLHHSLSIWFGSAPKTKTCYNVNDAFLFFIENMILSHIELDQHWPHTTCSSMALKLLILHNGTTANSIIAIIIIIITVL